MAKSKKFRYNIQEDLPPSVVEDMIRQRAYEIYEARGREEGRELEHWAEAEAEFREEGALQAAA